MHPSRSGPGPFLTGATGFLGGDLLRRLLAARPQRTVYCLVRARSAAHLAERRAALLARAGIGGPDAARVVALCGDVTQPDLGLGAQAARIAASTDEIFHVAASTKFDLDLASARAINCGGTEHVLAFARAARAAGGLRRLQHVSTAYVAGGLAGEIREDDVPASPQFRNSYEQSKWEAERLVRAAMHELPATIVRPSIVVGDSRTGETLHFRVLYDPMRWIYSGKVDVLPCRKEVRLDVVPVDFVCRAMLALAERPGAEGGTYHLCAGAAGAMSIEQMVDRAVAAVNAHHAATGRDPIAKPALVSPDAAAQAPPGQREKLEKLFAVGRAIMDTHVPYMSTEQLFDTTRTRAALAGSDVHCPPLHSYFERIVRWGVARGFGAA